MKPYASWIDAIRDDIADDNYELRVSPEVYCKIRSLSFECQISPTSFDDEKWEKGLRSIFGFKIPRLFAGQSYKLVITG